MRLVINLRRYAQTLWYLRPIQIFYRVLNLFPKKVNLILNKVPTSNTFSEVSWFSFNKTSSFDGNNFFFLNKKKQFNHNIWTEKHDYLWSYNLHYLDFLNDLDLIDKKNYVSSWINNTNFASGVAYEPYPTSLRIVNLIKWRITESVNDLIINKSIFMQSRWLYKNIEWHLLANHLFANFKALTFAGYYFNDKESLKWLKFAKKNIIKQIHQQILPDGGHCELSPMYHNIILQDLIDLYLLNNRSLVNRDKNFENTLREAIEKMLFWSESICHQDQDIPFFNDSCLGISPKASELKKFISTIFKLKKFKNKDVNFFKHSGYISVIKNSYKALLDVGEVGFSHNPGHAHADSLSFELSINKNRVFVNSGVSLYGDSKQRIFQRSTAAHNTVEVNSKNSSDVWKGFRVAKRAKNLGTKITEKTDEIKITSSHNGYKNLLSGHIHKREWMFSDNKMIMRDIIIGKNTKSISRLYLHPNADIINVSQNEIKIKLNNKNYILVNIPDNEFAIKDSLFFYEFGKSKKNKCIEVILKNNKSFISVKLN